MTNEDILRMAREADPFDEYGRLYAIAALTPKTLARFAALVAAAEREECAKVCESYAEPKALPSDPLAAWCQGSMDCAAAIRARGEP